MKEKVVYSASLAMLQQIIFAQIAHKIVFQLDQMEYVINANKGSFNQVINAFINL